MDHKGMAQQETYPSPTAAQTGSGVSPYQHNQPDPNEDQLDLNAHLHNHHNSHDVHASMAGQAYNTANAQQMSPRQQYGYPPGAAQMPYTGQIPGITGPGAPQTPEDSARKKSKVTRACDECRRKKIKCDAESDAPDAPKCSNCQRTNADCQFSRPPQKRGPSKGYIKELSDRVAQLESGGGRSEFDSPGLGGFSSGSKRSHSMSDTQFGSYADFGRPDAPKTFGPVLIPEAHMQTSSSKAEDLGIQLGTPGGPQTYRMERALNDVEEKNIQTFMSKVNPVIPLLGSRDGINTNLSFCPPPLRTAFYFAIGAVVGTLETSSGEHTREQCANSVLQEIRQGGSLSPASDNPDGDWSRRPYQANIIYLQTLLLCVLYYQSSGPAQPDPLGTSTCDQLLLLAHKMVMHLKLKFVKSAGNLGSGSEVNRVFANARRTFWVFVCLDVWNSLGTRIRRYIPYYEGLKDLTSQDRDLLKDGTFYDFVRVTIAAGGVADHMFDFSPNSANVSGLGRTFLCLGLGEPLGSSMMDEAPKTTFATLAPANLALLAYCLKAGPVPCPATPEIVEAALKISTMLATIELPTQGLPMTHHFVVPAVKVLLKAADYSLQRPNACAGLRDILSSIRTKGILDGSSWNFPIVQAIEDKLNDDKGMRNLANAAAGEMGSENDMSMDFLDSNVLWPALVLDGYLNGPLM